MGTKPGDIYTAQIMTIKIKKGIPTVISMDGRIYSLQSAYQPKGVKKSAK
jgi:hypothetical protein